MRCCGARRRRASARPSVDGEEYLHAPGYDAGGMYITGEPFILIGRNGHIAWTTTSEELVDQRIYVEHNVNFAASPPTYEFDGKQVPMRAISETIPVAGQPPVSFTVLRTKDGPGRPRRPRPRGSRSRCGSPPGTGRPARWPASPSSAATRT